ncbi:ATP-binding cassette domain-containing protein [Paenibacillus oralis]|uniref:ATP-binding cassette domain-containing protein n=1 Tax=Paenibacillus oralis TaxID=2490856 RepID=A0A3P3U003_9BACL|nr:ATP-binding cassette domain-containing protein [Paenibacillus oralis]RRJ63394.1 ATP-binding cassette domain-containing protein [Paenibacillus oralis]
MSLIEVEHVSKAFRLINRTPNQGPAILSLLKRQYEWKKAVDDISFSIGSGELVGYIGANGAGKSTTIKMLAGILVPTEGLIRVQGKVPWKNRRENARKIGVVFGQRTQLYWNLPMEETFDLFRMIYKIDKRQYRKNFEFYIELLEMSSFLKTPVRQLSLGQRMRAEIVVALLHDPEIVYLDEPTIGLDVAVKAKIREFIRQVNQEKNTTFILTTHDMKDIDYICDRIITIDQGKLIFDGTLKQFKNRFTNGHQLVVKVGQPDISVSDPRLVLLQDQGLQKSFLFRKEEISIVEALALISKQTEIIDIEIKEPEIEDAVKQLYQHKSSDPLLVEINP